MSATAAYASRPVNPHRLLALQRHAGATVLDVGCGNGSYVAALADRSVVGLDYSLFDTWRSAPGRFVVGEASKLPFSSGAFETVSCFETLEHLATPEVALRELARVAARNVIVTVPHCEITPGQRRSGLIYHHWVDRTHRNFWTLDEIRDLVAAAGLTVVDAYLINEITLAPLIKEAYAGSVLGRLLSSALLRFGTARKYPMTSLVVAEHR